jgi:hypothetical protein
VKRLIAIAVVVMLANIPAAGAAPFAGAGQWAIAVWWKVEQKSVFMYWVSAYQGVDTVAPGSLATVARVRCIEVGRNSLRCPEPTESVTIAPTDFTVDPMLESAVLDTTIGGIHHTLTWTPRDEESGISEWGAIDEEGADHFVTNFQSARIRGDVFGRKAGRTGYWIPTFGRSVGFWLRSAFQPPTTLEFRRWSIEVTPQ